MDPNDITSKYKPELIPVKDIKCDDEFNCRVVLTPESIQALADSIRQVGLLEPVIVQPWPNEGYAYRIVAGHRRFKACVHILKWDAIPAKIIELTELEAKTLNIVENIQRQELNIVEEAIALKRAYPNQSVLDIIRAINKPRQWVTLRLQIAEMDKSVQEVLAAAKLSVVDLKRLLRLPSPKDQLMAIKEIDTARQVALDGRQNDYLKSKLKNNVQRPNRFKLRAKACDLLAHGLDGLLPRALLYAAGDITEDDFNADIRQLAEQKLREAEQAD